MWIYRDVPSLRLGYEESSLSKSNGKGSNETFVGKLGVEAAVITHG